MVFIHRMRNGRICVDMRKYALGLVTKGGESNNLKCEGEDSDAKCSSFHMGIYEPGSPLTVNISPEQ